MEDRERWHLYCLGHSQSQNYCGVIGAFEFRQFSRQALSVRNIPETLNPPFSILQVEAPQLCRNLGRMSEGTNPFGGGYVGASDLLNFGSCTVDLSSNGLWACLEVVTAGRCW